MKIDPRHLEILSAIVEAGGLSEGAALIGKSQPSVSRSLAMLESRLGEKLFLPKRRPLVPTELGMALAREGQRIRDAGQTASRLVAEFQSGNAGTIRVAGTPIFMDGVISGMIAEFQMQNTNIRIDQSYGYPQELLDLLDAGSLDMALMPARQSDLPGQFSFQQILPGRNVIACRVDHPLARAKTIALKDVTKYPWIAPPANSPLFRDLRATLDGIGMRALKVGFTGGTLTAVLNVLSASDSLTVLPYSVVFTLQRQNRLTALPLRIGDPDRHLGIVTLKSGGQSKSTAHFCKFINARFESLHQAIAHSDRKA